MRELTGATSQALFALHLMVRRKGPVSVREIGRAGGIPPLDVRRVLGRLRRAGLVKGFAGRGFGMAKAPAEITVLEVVRATAAMAAPQAPCGGDYDACDSRASCVLAPLCRRVDLSQQDALRSFTLAELAEVPAGLPNCEDPKHRSAG